MDEKVIVKRVVESMVRQAKISMLDWAITQQDVLKLEDNVDEQTWRLAIDVYQELQKDLELSNNQHEALNRLKNATEKARSNSPELHRNNIFKAAHALGIKLPSMSF